MFAKNARVSLLGSVWNHDGTGFARTASVVTASHFAQQAGRIDVESVLKEVAGIYKISQDPRDYLFTPVRANSVDVPNENGDAFDREESLRFDHKIGFPKKRNILKHRRQRFFG